MDDRQAKAIFQQASFIVPRGHQNRDLKVGHSRERRVSRKFFKEEVAGWLIVVISMFFRIPGRDSRYR